MRVFLPLLGLFACDGGEDILSRNDLVVPPDCRDLSVDDWVAALVPSASWEAEESLLIVLLEVRVDAIRVDDLELLPELSSEAADVSRVEVREAGLVLTAQVTPPYEVDEVLLRAKMGCGSQREDLAIRLDTSAAPQIGGAVPVVVE